MNQTNSTLSNDFEKKDDAHKNKDQVIKDSDELTTSNCAFDEIESKCNQVFRPDTNSLHKNTPHIIDGLCSTYNTNVYKPRDDRDDALTKETCANCTTTEIVDNVHKFQRGQHIAMPGKSLTVYFKKFKTLKNFYEHHFIVKEVVSAIGTLVVMVIINFTEIGGVTSVYEETKTYDLRNQELRIVHYAKPRYNTDETLKRAESMVLQNEKFKSYNLLCTNCEHFVTWCVTGEGESFQIQRGIKRIIVNSLLTLSEIGSKLAKVIVQFTFLSADEVTGSLKIAAPDMVFGKAAVMYLFYCIIMTVIYLFFKKKGRICVPCVKEKIKEVWFKFLVFGALQILILVNIHFAMPLMSPAIGIPVAILLILFSLCLQIVLPRLRRAMSCPFKVNRTLVKNLNTLFSGDVISFHLNGFRHTSIVSEVDTKTGRLRIIHYGKSSLFGPRIVIEEYIDLTKYGRLNLLDCRYLNVYQRDVVVNRARSRIGEMKWKLFSNRSNHLSYWAKVRSFDEDSEYINKNRHYGLEIEQPLSAAKVSLFMKEKEIHRVQDLRKGDVMKSRKIGLINNTGILSSIKYLHDSNERKFELEIITYSLSRVVAEERVDIDLNKDVLYVKLYNSALCYDMEQRVCNAQELLGQKGKWWTTRGFIEHCIEKK